MNIKKTKEKIIGSLEDERLMPFEIIVKGDSGNCSIGKAEEGYIENSIAKGLMNMGIDDFDIVIKC